MRKLNKHSEQRKRCGHNFVTAAFSLLDCKTSSYYLLLFFTSCIIRARTFSGSPNRVMKPSASW